MVFIHVLVHVFIHAYRIESVYVIRKKSKDLLLSTEGTDVILRILLSIIIGPGQEYTHTDSQILVALTHTAVSKYLGSTHSWAVVRAWESCILDNFPESLTSPASGNPSCRQIYMLDGRGSFISRWTTLLWSQQVWCSSNTEIWRIYGWHMVQARTLHTTTWGGRKHHPCWDFVLSAVYMMPI